MRPVVVNWGMGADSSYILARIFHDDKARASLGIAPDYHNLLVLTAQVGHEYQSTKQLGQKHILPLLRKHRVRLVQVARAHKSLKVKPVYVKLSDTRAPRVLHTKGGPWTLLMYQKEGGTPPQFRASGRTCSQKFKGVPLDAFLKDTFGKTPFVQVMGFNADEPGRAKKDDSYTAIRDLPRIPRYPLIRWKVGRKKLEDGLRDYFGVKKWPKSCCGFCPFQGTKAGRDDVMERIEKEPDAAAGALFLEHLSMSFNPRQPLFAQKGGAKAFFETRKNTEARKAFLLFERMLRESEWGLYQVRRVYYPDKKGRRVGARKLVILGTGPKAAMDRALKKACRAEGLETETDDRGITRCWKRHAGHAVRALEELYVVAPVAAVEKKGPAFEKKWAEQLAQEPRRLPIVTSATPTRPTRKPKPKRRGKHEIITADELLARALAKLR